MTLQNVSEASCEFCALTTTSNVPLRVVQIHKQGCRHFTSANGFSATNQLNTLSQKCGKPAASRRATFFYFFFLKGTYIFVRVNSQSHVKVLDMIEAELNIFFLSTNNYLWRNAELKQEDVIYLRSIYISWMHTMILGCFYQEKKQNCALVIAKENKQ